MRGSLHLLLIGMLAIFAGMQASAQDQTEGEALGAASTTAASPTTEPVYDPVLDALDREFDRDNAATATSGPGASPPPPADDVDRVQIFRVLGGLCFVLGAIVGLGYVVRRFGGKTPMLAGAQLGQVMGKVYLNPKSSLVYVRSGGRVLLLGLTPSNITLVTEFDSEAFDDQLHSGAAAVPEPANGISFQTQMRRASARMGAAAIAEDADIDSIRGDLQRLQQFLEESKRDGEA